MAAGLSSRFQDGNKLLYEFRGKPLFSHVFETVRETQAEQSIVVFGSDVMHLIDKNSFTCVHNTRPQLGMGHSLKLGCEAICDHIDGVFVCLADMPLITLDVFQKLSYSFSPEHNQHICVPMYNHQNGHPVLFSAKFFPDLRQIEGDQGAKGILRTYKNQVVSVPVNDKGVLTDFDRLEDFSSHC